MTDGMLKSMLLTFAAASGITFITWVIYLIKQGQKKDAQIAVKETELEYKKLQGEIDDSSLLSIVRRNNKRTRRDS